MMSIMFWMVAQVPQFVKNIKQQRADALSAWFLAEWLLGDTCNLIGCLMTGNQLPTVTYTAMYFIFADVCLIMQYIYFQTLQRRKERLSLMRARLRPDNPVYRHAVRHPATMGEEFSDATVANGTAERQRSFSLNKSPRVLACAGVLLLVRAHLPSQSLDPGRVLLPSRRHLLVDAAGELGSDSNKGRPNWVVAVGTMIGWTSSGFYLSSRLSQIWKNWCRKSAEGLSMAMFACAIAANLSYGLGIIIRSYHWEDVVSSAPWLLGSLGTVTLDMVIFLQGFRYEPLKSLPVYEQAAGEGEAQPLVLSAADSAS
eukprot:jgi/Astpho2/2/Aster-07461